MKKRYLKVKLARYTIYENLTQLELDEIINIAIKGSKSKGILDPSIETDVSCKSNLVTIINKNPNGPTGYKTSERKVHDIYGRMHNCCNLHMLDVENVAIGINANIADIQLEYSNSNFKYCG